MVDTPKPIRRTKSKTLIIISRLASFISHPLLITAFTAISLYQLFPSEIFVPGVTPRSWMTTLIIFTVILPFVAILSFRLLGLISDAIMHQAKDRTLPLVATMIFYILTYWMFTHKYAAPVLMQSLLLGSCAAIALIFLINFFYKVSVHTTAAAIFPGMGIVLFQQNETGSITLLALACLMALFVGVIRWLLGAHTTGQIILGYLIGIVTQQAAYFLLSGTRF